MFIAVLVEPDVLILSHSGGAYSPFRSTQPAFTTSLYGRGGHQTLASRFGNAPLLRHPCPQGPLKDVDGKVDHQEERAKAFWTYREETWVLRASFAGVYVACLEVGGKEVGEEWACQEEAAVVAYPAWDPAWLLGQAGSSPLLQESPAGCLSTQEVRVCFCLL